MKDEIKFCSSNLHRFSQTDLQRRQMHTYYLEMWWRITNDDM